MRTPASLTRFFLPILVGLAFVAGCSSPQGKFQSKRAPAYQGKLDRVLVIYQNEEDAVRDLGRKFSDAFLTRLTESLTAKGVLLEVVRPRKGDLDPNVPVREAATRFRPRQVVYFGLTSVVGRAGWSSAVDVPQLNHATSLTFTFSLADVSRNEIVWRGDVRYPVIPDAPAVADQFVEQLRTAGFLKGS